MSAALATHTGPDSSSITNQTHPDISLSLGSNTFSTPSRLQSSFRAPSASSRGTSASSAPISTPSQPIGSLTTVSVKKRGEEGVTPLTSRLSNLLISGRDKDDDGINAGVADEPPEGEMDVLGTPGGKKWGDAANMASRGKRGAAGSGNGMKPSGSSGNKGVTLTLRDQEKHIDNLKKENFAIKLRVHFLEERLAQLAPDHIDAALKQNISLKIEVQQRGMEMKKLKKLVLDLERELERLQQGGSTSSSRRERELEERLEERERELRELREGLQDQRRRNTDHYDEGRQGDLLRDAETRNEELEEQLECARGLLEENVEEINRLQDLVERQQNTSLQEVPEPNGHEYKRLKRRAEGLEADNSDLRARLQDHAELLARKEEEKEDVIDENDALKLEIEELHRKRDADFAERSQSRAAFLEEREEREAAEEDINALKDRLAAVMIELQQKEDDLDLKSKEMEEIVREHQHIVNVVEDEWRGEVEEARTRLEELQDVLAERESESRDLRLNIAELEANTNELHSKFEAALVQLEADVDQKEAEIESLNETIQRLGQQIYHLEDEIDRNKEDSEKIRNDEIAEREYLKTMCATSKEKIVSLKLQLEEAIEAYDSTCSKQEELARHVEDLVRSLDSERMSREKIENDQALAARDHELRIRQEQRGLEAKDTELRNALANLERAQSLLAQREKDLGAVQDALKTKEKESKLLGETHTTARFSLQLEVEKMTRDLERAQDDLLRARKDVEDKEKKIREKEETIDHLHAEKLQLKSQLAAQTQAKLNVSEKLDSVQATLKGTENENTNARARIHDLESRLARDQRELLSSENQYRDQLTERNTLLLTIYQYMDKILGVDKTPGGQAETKPFTNFSVFHDNLISRLKALSQIQLDFDRRFKEAEARFTEKLADIKKQFDQRWRQLDKFEASLKTYAETKAQWRRKVSAKEGEIEALKATNAELSAHVTSAKRPVPADSMEFKSMSARAANAERRLTNAQNQLLASEEKIATMNQRNIVADTKWDVRVKEYETRLKAAEERVKIERQGSKDRIAEMEKNIKSLQRQLDLAQKRNQQLSDVLDPN